jgi:cation diffusion facilitator CzcD-associated flavoprotein CzcO
MTDAIETPTLIIGAGPAGLAVAGRMRRLGFPFEMIDASDALASSWRRHYDRLHLHTVKGLSHLPYEAFPDDYPRYVSRDQLVEYYERYAEKYLIDPSLGVSVERVVKAGDRWRVETETGQPYLADTVVVATGANRVPNRPVLEGEEAFEGEISHSRTYKNPGPFLGRRVLVVGMGNTGAEIALDLCEHGVTAVISVRGPVNVVPRDSLGMPTQLTARALDGLPNRMADAIGRAFRRVSFGDLEPWGIRTPRLAPMAQLRTLGKTPVIDVGTVRRIKKGEIAVRPGVRSLTPTGVVFSDGSEEPFDAIILATGYRSAIEEIVEDGASLLDPNGFPGSVIAEGRFDGLYFTGFDNYKAGGVLGTLLDESEEIVEDIARRRDAS